MSGDVHADKPIQQLEGSDRAKRAGLAASLAFSGLILGAVVVIILIVWFAQRKPAAQELDTREPAPIETVD